MRLLTSSFTCFSTASLLVILAASADAGMIFDNGVSASTNGFRLTGRVLAEDFSLTSDSQLESVEVWVLQNQPVQTISYHLFVDNGGSPASSAFASGTAQNLVGVDTGQNVFSLDEYRYTFDLQFKLSLTAATDYWFGISASPGGPGDLFWSRTNPGKDEIAKVSLGGTFDNWLDASGSHGEHFAFNLSGSSGVAAVPEPSSLTLVGIGMLAMIYRRKMRRTSCRIS